MRCESIVAGQRRAAASNRSSRTTATTAFQNPRAVIPNHPSTSTRSHALRATTLATPTIRIPARATSCGVLRSSIQGKRLLMGVLRCESIVAGRGSVGEPCFVGKVGCQFLQVVFGQFGPVEFQDLRVKAIQVASVEVNCLTLCQCQQVIVEAEQAVFGHQVLCRLLENSTGSEGASCPRCVPVPQAVARADSMHTSCNSTST